MTNPKSTEAYTRMIAARTALDAEMVTAEAGGYFFAVDEVIHPRLIQLDDALVRARRG